MRSRIYFNQLSGDSEDVRLLESSLRERFGERLTVSSHQISFVKDSSEHSDCALDDYAVMLVVLGRDWVAALESGSDAGHESSNVVRRLLTSALSDELIVTIPVLVPGAARLRPEDLPNDLRPLALRQMVELRKTDWTTDTEQLIGLIQSALEHAGELDRAELARRERARAIDSAIARARTAVAQGEFDGALVCVEEALALEADHAEALALRQLVEAAVEAQRARRQLQKGAQETPQAAKVDENVQFTVYRRSVVQPGRWYMMLVFAHLAEKRPDAPAEERDPILEVQMQARQVLGENAESFQPVTSDSQSPVMREGELRVVPHVEGVEFNPSERRFLWSESVHREEFRMRAADSLHGSTARGVVTIYSGNLLLADVRISIRVDRDARKAENERSLATPYRRIFASYSHIDRSVVEEFELHAKATGDRYLRDLVSLRSGEVWNERILEMIRSADVFQLFWSWNAMKSQLVSAEWQYALTLNRAHFVRPVYWEEPLPERPGLPPPDLRSLHFERVYPRPAVAVAVAPEGAGTPEPTVLRPASLPMPRQRQTRPRANWSWSRFLATPAFRVAAATIPLLVLAVYVAVSQRPQASLPLEQPPAGVTSPGAVPTDTVPAQPEPRPPSPEQPGRAGRGTPPRAPGLTGFSIDEITLRGLERSGDTYVAVVEGADGRTYQVRQGDRLSDGVVGAVSAEGVVFIQDVSDPLAAEKQKTVVKRLGPRPSP